MGFAALISAYQDAEDGEAQLRALLPMAGRTLLENQVRRAEAAGASHIVLLVERVPAALNEALDRLKRDGITANIARAPAEAADHFHPEEDVLLVADGLVAAPDCFEAMAIRKAPTLLVVSDIPENEHFERVDANMRWAGLALTDAKTLAETAAMLGEWDLQSTLMRKIVQSGATYLPVDGDGGAVVDAREAVVLAERSDSSRHAGRTMLARNSRNDESWPEKFLFSPLADLVAPSLLDRGVESLWLRIASLVFGIGGVVAIAFGWLWSGLALLQLVGPLSAIAARIDMAQLRDRAGGWESTVGKGIVYAAALLAMGYHFRPESGVWLILCSAILAICLLMLVGREAKLYGLIQAKFGRLWPIIATGDAAIWLLPVFAIPGFWQYWPAGVAIYAVISLVLLQEMLKRVIANAMPKDSGN